ncbi:MAG TPA: hypothetical protein VIK18_22815 [Pirellulales bacterium]
MRRSWNVLSASWRRLLGLVRRPSKRDRDATEFETARRHFHQHRERLEAKFFELASGSGKPRGLRWTDCDFDDDVTYARDRRSAELCAFVAVTIAFDAIEGGLMEGVEAVGNLRAASAVFRLDHGRWQTDGRAIFNLSPSEAIAYYQDNLVLVGHEPSGQR